MFKFSLSSRELFHSNFLEWLAIVNNNGFKNLMDKLVGNCITWPEHWRVKREFQKLDLCILAYDNQQDFDQENDKKATIILVIENKVKSMPYKEQLVEYEQKVDSWNKKNKKGKSKKECRFILLTLAEVFPEKRIIENNKIWKIIGYKSLSKDIKDCFLNNGVYNSTTNSLHSEIINDYCQFVSNLSSLVSIWYNEEFRWDSPFLYYNKISNKSRDFFAEYEEARKIRIHDLYQKLKFSQICSWLYNIVKIIAGGYAVFPNNKKGFFKNCKDNRWGYDKSYICVNYTFLHGEPLIELNVHPASNNIEEELYYTIQVQGDKYEHGAQMKMQNTGKGCNAEEAWEWLKKTLQDKNMVDWMYDYSNAINPNKVIVSRRKALLGKVLLPEFDINNQKKNNQFYKYETADNETVYIYQAREIIKGDGKYSNGPAIIDIVCQMLEDLIYLLRSL